MRLRFLCLLLFILHCSTIYAEEIDGKALLKKGSEELEGKKYEDAIKSLSIAEKEFPLLGDYALLWLSETYHETGNHGEALKTIRSFLKKYPDSPLKKKARLRELQEAGEVPEENIQYLFESFIKDYPKNTDVKYFYAQLLKKCNPDAAKLIFKEICIGASPLSDMACNELGPNDLQARDLIEKASNLMKLKNYKEAESVLRSAMEKDDGSLRDEILRNLGLVLFRLKRYREAADVYEKANEGFWKVYSLYRAGGKDAFNSALEKFLKSEDMRTGIILVAVAADKRRDGEIQDALTIYQKVVEHYPAEKEDALWGIGWTYFMSGAYEKATDIFTKLSEVNDDSKYLYWKARSLEASGKDVSNLYSALRKRDKDFYGVMSFLRTGGCLEKYGVCENQESFHQTVPCNGTKNHEKNRGHIEGTYGRLKKFERIEILLELGFSKDAISELIFISKTANSIEDILYIGSKLLDLGEYKYLIKLTASLPYTETVHHLRYPYAYWNIVKPVSEQHTLDPLFVLSIMREESTFDPNARSAAGALGLMQLMPQTAYHLNSELHLGIVDASHVLNIKNNIHIGTFYLSVLMKEFGSYAYSIAAYNAGEEKVREWIRKGKYKSIDEFIEDIPYRETRNYVKRVVTTFSEYKRSSENN